MNMFLYLLLQQQNLIPLKFEIENQSFMIKLADIFEKMEKSKSDLKVNQYSIAQSTLEHIFIRFARESTISAH